MVLLCLPHFNSLGRNSSFFQVSFVAIAPCCSTCLGTHLAVATKQEHVGYEDEPCTTSNLKQEADWLEVHVG
eukprot:738271-Amphidinium_carterae.2